MTRRSHKLGFAAVLRRQAERRGGSARLRSCLFPCFRAGNRLFSLDGAGANPGSAVPSAIQSRNPPMRRSSAARCISSRIRGRRGGACRGSRRRKRRLSVEVLTDPARLVIDLEGVIFAGSGDWPRPRRWDRSRRGGQGCFMLGQSRIVLDLARPALVERIDFVRQAGIVRLVAADQGVPQAKFDEQARARSGPAAGCAIARNSWPDRAARLGRGRCWCSIPAMAGLIRALPDQRARRRRRSVLAIAKAMRERSRPTGGGGPDDA